MTLRTEVLLDAATLLEADLVWSSDFEAVRANLAMWLRAESSKGVFASLFASSIATALVEGLKDA